MASEEQRKKFSNPTTKEFTAHKSSVRSLAWNCDGRKLASSSDDMTVKVWNVESSKEVKESELKEHTNSVEQIQWQPNNVNILGTASSDRSCRIWDTRTKKATAIQTKEENLFLAWHKNGNYIALGDKTDVLMIYDIRVPSVLCSLSFSGKYWVNEGVWLKDSDMLVLAVGESKLEHSTDYLRGSMEIVNVDFAAESMESTGKLICHGAQCLYIRTDPTESYIATGGSDGVVGLYDMDNMSCVHAFTSVEEAVTTVAFNYDGTILCGSGKSSKLELWHVPTRTALPKLKTSLSPISSAWHPKQNILACGNEVTRDSRATGTIGLYTF